MYSSIAFAENGQYTAGVNSYTNILSDGAKTVLIYKGGKDDPVTAENIYYINQDDSEYGFSKLEMMMKRDAPAGVYTFLTDKDGASTTFEISNAQANVSGGEEIKCLGTLSKNADSTYSAAFGINTEYTLTEDAKISMLIGDKLYTISLFDSDSIIKWICSPLSFDLQGEQRTTFALMIDGISNDYVSTDSNETATPKFKLYLKN